MVNMESHEAYRKLCQVALPVVVLTSRRSKKRSSMKKSRSAVVLGCHGSFLEASRISLRPPSHFLQLSTRFVRISLRSIFPTYLSEANFLHGQGLSACGIAIRASCSVLLLCLLVFQIVLSQLSFDSLHDSSSYRVTANAVVGVILFVIGLGNIVRMGVAPSPKALLKRERFLRLTEFTNRLKLMFACRARSLSACATWSRWATPRTPSACNTTTVRRRLLPDLLCLPPSIGVVAACSHARPAAVDCNAVGGHCPLSPRLCITPSPSLSPPPSSL
jgi:hypothetical protein